MKKLIVLLFIALMLFLSGCRERVTSPNTSIGDGILSNSSVMLNSTSGEDIVSDEGRDTREDETAAKKEYDENSNASVFPETGHALTANEAGSAASYNSSDASVSSSVTDDTAVKTATRTVSAEQADKKGTSDDAENAESPLQYYTVLLEERLSRLFECQKRDLYLELTRDYLTIHKSSDLHGFILGAGAYDVSSKLLAENLVVTPGWVQRKNPGMIVKIVDSSVLGQTTDNYTHAKYIYDDLLNRPDWNTIDAVKNGRILLISEQLLDSNEGRVAAQLFIAKLCAPDAFEDTDPFEAMKMLVGPEGKYVYYR